VIYPWQLAQLVLRGCFPPRGNLIGEKYQNGERVRAQLGYLPPVCHLLALRILLIQDNLSHIDRQIVRNPTARLHKTSASC
jgi:hypothetical protein